LLLHRPRDQVLGLAVHSDSPRGVSGEKLEALVPVDELRVDLDEDGARPVFAIRAQVRRVGVGNWAYVSPSLPISTNPAVNPTNRTVASLVLLSIARAPTLIGSLLTQRYPREALAASLPATP